jgi:hypothetical protein
MRPFETSPGMGKGRIKNDRAGEFKYDLFGIL